MSALSRTVATAVSSLFSRTRTAASSVAATRCGAWRAYTDRQNDSSLAYAILPAFERGFNFSSPYNKITVIGAPFSDGQSFTGSDEGPKLLREAGLYVVVGIVVVLSH